MDNEGEILRVNENFKGAPKEMAVWDLIEEISPLNTWDGDIYNEKYTDSISMHVMRPYKRIKWVVATKKVGNFQIQRDEEKEIWLLAADECCKQDYVQHVDKKSITTARRGIKLFKTMTLGNLSWIHSFPTQSCQRAMAMAYLLLLGK